MAPKERYGYAVARLRALENRLLDDSVLQRMIECDTLEAAVKVLSETSYSAWLMDLKSPAEYDRAIEAELLHSYTEAGNFVPDKELVSLLRVVYDVHNVKTLLKSQFLASENGEKRRTDLLTPLGSISIEKLTAAIDSEEYWELPYGFDQAIPEALAVWEQNHNALAVEKILDRVYFEALLKTAEQLNMPQVTEWVRSRIDGENLKTLLRLSRIDMDRSSTAEFLHDGGLVLLNRLIPLVAEPVENWSRLLAFADIGVLLAPFSEGGNFNEQLVQYEKNLDNFLTALIAKSRYSAFEPANVIRYLWIKEIEAKNLRVILVSVSNGVEKDDIRGLLRNVR
jgi:V/A-type H+-transporting ATPase subunit C